VHATNQHREIAISKRASARRTVSSGFGNRRGSNRKASLYLAQKRFCGMAILCADDKSVISKYENVSFWRTGHFFLDFVS
jgi:hypothetical protein